MQITEYAVKNRLATAAIASALVVLGLYGLWRLPVDYLPAVTYPLVKVHIRWPGATPEEIDRRIADPVERLMATVDHLDSLEATFREGVYTLDVNFEYGANVDTAFQDVLAALTRAEQHLPRDIDPPFVFKADPSQLPVLHLTVSSDRWGPVALREWTDNWLQDQLLGVRGVAGTEIVGGLEREIRILLDPLALEKHQISLQSVFARLEEENIEQTGGRITVGRRELIARTLGEFQDLEQIAAVPLTHNRRNSLYLRDVAEVLDGHEEVRIITRLNGQDCVRIAVMKEAEANTVEVARAVEDRLDELAPSLPQGIQMRFLENQADYVAGALAGVRNAAIQAMILLILVVYAFLGSWRQVLVMAVALPLTLIINFGVMAVAGFSLNIFSLGGLVVAIGVVLDNSLVVIESIHRSDRQRRRAAADICGRALPEPGDHGRAGGSGSCADSPTPPSDDHDHDHDRLHPAGPESGRGCGHAPADGPRRDRRFGHRSPGRPLLHALSLRPHHSPEFVGEICLGARWVGLRYRSESMIRWKSAQRIRPVASSHGLARVRKTGRSKDRDDPLLHVAADSTRLERERPETPGNCAA